ncbi:mitogen-activated protein kinase kinase kinase 4 isoform X3 [Diachasmimorpha longicaudata]|uniref:mitogen-activated protein kinase kinase kinase 4 isoform X3 n=1 Tax=Diachasmimorpha longicaudata TaxID=58733 RepID=UPI0030B869FD
MSEYWGLDYERRDSVSPPSSDDPLHEMSDFYGQTPPRTRQSRRQRERKQRTSWGEPKSSPAGREVRAKPSICRRDTLDTMIFNKMCEDADEARIKEEAAKEGSRKSKRSLKLARGSERDLKLDVEAAAHYAERSERRSTPVPCNMKVWRRVIETRNRFRCLRSKPVDSNHKRREPALVTVPAPPTPVDSIEEAQPKNLLERQVFHDTFAFLIRLGSTDREKNCKRQMSSEESRWQNELKDLIWLELQAYHADRSLMAQDEYLCRQREAIGPLLTEIMDYKYNSDIFSNPPSVVSSSNDRGFNGSTPLIIEPMCMGCLRMRCRSCSKAQLIALKQVEGLLCRLEAAEALYPSCQAFGVYYPMYKSAEFTGRVKAMCLWYNMTRHHRLKLHILGKLLMLLDSPKNMNYEVDSGISSRSSETSDLLDPKPTVVRFELSSLEDSVNSTPSESTSSNSSTGGISLLQSWPSTPESTLTCLEDHRFDCLDQYLPEFDRQAYRKYIEEVLKTRGLSKSLNFLERLHTSVLRKASLALKKWTSEDELSTNEEYEGDIELKRYGVWSPEAKALNLPSYRSAFIFLSRVPLDIVHEFLRMRLEQKPEQPGPLSVRQLMREMREGLRIACIHRDRFVEHSKTVHAFDDSISGKSLESPTQSPLVEFDDVKDFDDSLKAVFEVYLDYLRQWVDMVQYNSFHKSLIDDEWSFVKSIAGGIKHGHKIGGIKFCDITCTMIEQIQEFLVTKPQEIKETTDALEGDVSVIKLHLMSVGREWQGMFVEAREKITKCLTFAKSLKKDISQWPDASGDLGDAVFNMKNVILSLRDRLIVLIEDFQATVDEAEEPKSENDLFAMRTRVREILHQAYRMGFDYHKEVCKLFSPEERNLLVHGLVDFAMLWMDFVKNRCERGRGLRPRWANNGFEYLMTICEPLNTRYLSDGEFEALKEAMDRCISHVVGTANSSGSHSEQEGVKRLPRSRASSPASSGSRSSFSMPSKSKDSLRSPEANHRKYSSLHSSDGSLAVNLIVPETMQVKKERILGALKKLEFDIDERRRGCELIGRVTSRKSVDKIKVRIRRVTFTWQRGIKIGQGRFGKVYTVVNNQTGELLAMKEVPLQPGDHRAVRRLVEELQIFEGIQHKHLVRYDGIEIQREEMLLFMEFCAEGTLESLVAGSGNGLPEIFIRKYTHQLLLAVSVLHNHGIVHRDIKTANIFLTDQGNCLKLGDFGCAVQIKAHTTMPGELQGFVGTQAYMAPEVFMKTESGGHGRAADVWSVGCCVVEMASGKRPWAEFDSNYQIMFKVGMGESPAPPKHLCKEGVDLASKCLTHDPKKRPTANILLSHPFARNYDDVNVDLLNRVVS